MWLSPQPMSQSGVDVEGSDRSGLYVGLPDSTFFGGESDGKLASFMSLREVFEKKLSHPKVKAHRAVRLERVEEKKLPKVVTDLLEVEGKLVIVV